MADLVPFKIHTNGKLLLTGEYFVLDGAEALAVPAKFGQHLKVGKGEAENLIHWTSLDHQGKTWFEARFSVGQLDIISSDQPEVAEQLRRILKEAQRLTERESVFNQGLEMVTVLDFPRTWGLGSSSTLIAAIAQWLEVDAYDLLWNSFGGSGYDIACALAEGPILYQIEKQRPVVTACQFAPAFKDNLFFVYLGKKQSSREAIQNYRSKGKILPTIIDEVSVLTQAMLHTASQQDFDQVLEDHENLVSRELNLPKVKDLFFRGFPGPVKSLGAWGGDFVLASSPMSPAETELWFHSKGYKVVLNFEDMILNPIQPLR